MEFSLYENYTTQINSLLSIENYIGFIQHGNNQDLVLKARVLKQKGDEEGYKKLKNTSKGITGSAVFESGDKKTGSNVKYMNGNIILDIDHAVDSATVERIKNDKYTMIIHQSFGGIGYCIFVKIDPDKFENSFLGLQEYYHNNFGVRVDPACKNIGRIRYISYDPDIYYNPKSIKFIPKEVKRFKEPKIADYAFHQDDFDYILEQIRDRSIDLCQEDYFRYMRIGMSIAAHFQEYGRDKFHFICSFGSKYNEKNTDRDYTGFIKNGENKLTIATLYYYVKDAGLSIYTEKTKIIINKVKVGKAQGKPTRESIASNLKVAHDIIANDDDYKLIDALISSNRDYSTEANEDISEIEELQNFVVDTYSPSYDSISKSIILNHKTRMGDRELNNIYISCKKNLNMKVPKDDIKCILNSDSIPKINPLIDFFRDNADYKPNGLIEEYAMCIYPQCDYNVWAVKKWLVGAIHNWTSGEYDLEVSPLTLILTGQDHGVGKTTWIRNLLPLELRKYHTQEKISVKDKDSLFRLCTSLIVYDDEFGGDGFKDEKAFKALSDMPGLLTRRPYASGDDYFKRMAMLCGSTNELDILKDSTGNRRKLPILVESIDYDKVLSLDKVGLVMEAYHLYQSGFDWKLRTKEDIQYIKDNTSINESVLPIEEIFFKHFQLESGGSHLKEVVYNQGEILEYLNNHSPMKPNKFELKEVLVKNKLVYKVYRVGEITKKGVRLYIRYSDSDIQIPSF